MHSTGASVPQTKALLELPRVLLNAKCAPEAEDHMELTTQRRLNQLGKFHKKKHFFLQQAEWLAGHSTMRRSGLYASLQIIHTLTYAIPSPRREESGEEWQLNEGTTLPTEESSLTAYPYPMLTKGTLRPPKINRTRKGNQYTPFTKPLLNASTEAS